MTDKQSEALRLADALDELGLPHYAAELRRLHDLNTDKTEIIAALSARITALETANAELLEALKSCIEYGSMTGDEWVADKARAAVAKHGGAA